MKKLIIPVFIILTLLAVVCFPYSSTDAATFTKVSQDPEKTMDKYASFWDRDVIVKAPKQTVSYEDGEQIATVTIPALNMYEMPLYYGSKGLNSDWQLTTPSVEEGWGTFSDKAPTALGAHNYQLMGKLPTMNVGDKFIVETAKDVYVYETIKKVIYNADTDDWGELVNAGGDYSVILMTCYPIDALSTDNRYLVYGKLRNGTTFY